MPANEFEKQVQDQLGRFGLEPSASVWKKVEREITSKKRKRIIFFLVIPLAMALLGFTYYQLSSIRRNNEVKQQTVAVSTDISPAANPGENPLHTEPQKQSPGAVDKSNTDNIVTTKNAGATINTRATVRTGIADKNINQRPVSDPPIFMVDQNTPLKVKKATRNNEVEGPSMIASSNSPTVQKKPGNELEPATVIDNNTVVPGKLNSQNDRENDSAINNKKGSLVADNENEKKTEEISIVKPVKEEPAMKKKQHARVRWGVDVSAGYASNNRGTLSFARAQAFDLLTYNAPGSTTGAGVPAAIIPPSEVKAGTAFRVGVIAEWQLSKRSMISAGLQYGYSSNRIKVGTVTDTSVRLAYNSSSSIADVNVNEVYRGLPNNNHVNKYHFIRLPLSYHWQINQGKKLQLQWNAGMSAEYLFASNALLYSSALGGVYYRDKEAFNKWHVSLGTGLSFRFKTGNNYEWAIGPGLDFDVSRLLKSSDKQFLSFGGISAKLFLPKRKK